MISDVLSEATTEIDRYLSNFAPCYACEVRKRIVALRDEMEIVRAMLDTPPSPIQRTTMRLRSLKTGAERDFSAGTWISWMEFPPPKDIGPVLWERCGVEGRFSIDPASVNPEWNIFGVTWQVPPMEGG